ncbi:MAG: acyl-ACP--UDP-N-acetylglucosamine O-acyltransferase [Alphaproteobacteria bacterium]
MTNSIHPTAVIEDGASLGQGVFIGPYCVIGAHVTLGDNVTLKSHVVIEGHTSIGAGSIVYPFSSLGSAPQDLKYAGEDTRLIIGANNTIREHVTMNPGTVQGAQETRVGDNCLFMMGAHVAHDCVVGSHVILANNATLAGHVEVGDFVIIGGLSAVHQFSRIGDHAMIGGMSGVENDVIPYGLVKGERAALHGLNLIGLQRRGFSKDEIKTLKRVFAEVFEGQGTLDERLHSAKDAFSDFETAQEVIAFALSQSKMPLCQPPKK